MYKDDNSAFLTFVLFLNLILNILMVFGRNVEQGEATCLIQE